MAIYQITILSVLFGLISGYATQKASKSFCLFLAILFSFLTNIQMLSYYTTSRPLNYQVFAHMRLDSVAMAFDLFTPQVFLLVVLFFIFTFIYFFSSRLIAVLFNKSSNTVRQNLLFIIFGVCLFSLTLPSDSIIKHAYYLTRNLIPPDTVQDISSLMESYGIDNYVQRENITGSLGKNVIIISLESFERGFLDKEVFPDVAPNLRKMSEDWTFFPNFIQSKGSGWTSGALYAMLTGMPSYFGFHGNSIFQTTTETRLASLGDVFHSAGYNMTWFMSKPAHAGNAQLLKHYHFNTFHDSDHSIFNFEMSDANLFAHAKKKIAAYAENNEPFVIGISTISTHHPDGIPDENFRHMKKAGDSGIKYMARVTDYLVKDFCDFVLEHNSLKETVIFILPDHLAMSGNSALEELKSTGERSLYLLTNAPQENFRKKESDQICTLDLPRLILEGAQINSNIKFITESIDLDSLSERDFTDLNLNLWSRHNVKNGINIRFSPQGGILIEANGNIWLERQGYFQITEGGDIFVHYGQRTSNLLLTVNESRNSVCLGTQGRMFSCFTGQNTYSFTKGEIEFIQAIHRHGITEDPLSYLNHITIGSSGDRINPSYAIFGDFRVNFQSPGIILIFRNSLKTLVFNGLTPDTQPEPLVNAIIDGIKTNSLYSIIVNGDVTHMLSHVKRQLQSLNLERLALLSSGQSYIALHVGGGVFLEHSDKKSNFMIRMPQKTPLTPETSNRFTSELSSDPSRYIAHAGGSISGKTYTNSLEALNNTYQQGYRMFELDIITTSDHKFVAAHDWQHWAKITEYDGKIPPTHEIFMQQRIYDKFTPMDMDTINQWFSNHPDAILVTDKINSPINFANHFIDKNRLMMELFSVQALKEADEAELTPICNIRMLYNQYIANHDLTSFIHRYNIQTVALPTSFLNSQPLFIRYLFENDVHLYAYISNDADFISRHVGTKLYGVYTDNWPLSLSSMASKENGRGSHP